MCLDIAVLTALVTGTFTLLSVAITFYFTERRFKKQLKAQFLNRFREFRYETIKEIGIKFSKCQDVINNFGNSGAQNKKEAQEVTNNVKDFFNSVYNASIWVEKDIIDELLKIATLFKRMEMEIGFSVGQKPKIKSADWMEFQKVNSIFKKLRKISGIELFKEYEKTIE